MMIKVVRHVGIMVSDMEKSLKFYRDLLGLKVKSLVDEEGKYLDNMLSNKDVKNKIAKLYAGDGDTMIELIMSKSHENKKDRDFFTIGASHCAFTVDNLQKTYEHLLKNGIKFNAPPQLPPDGNAKVTFCEDPDGTPIELVEVINSDVSRNILEKKNCVITGATGGLGREIAIELAKKNCNLFLTSLNENLEELKQELDNLNNGILIKYQHSDLRKAEDVDNLIRKIREEFTSIDILVNCAGENHRKSLSESTLDEFDSCMNLNVRAPFILCKEFSKDMTEKKWGRIVNIASSSAHDGFKNAAIYCSSKHALLGLSRTLFTELKDSNIRTFCVSPGSMKTRMAKEDVGLLTDHDYNLFLDPNEVAEFITKIISYDNEMISQEISLSRLNIN